VASDLEKRIQRLEAIEEIKVMKHHYLHSLDKRKIEEAISTFTDDAVADYGHKNPDNSKIVYKGKEAIMGLFKNMGARATTMAHLPHSSEIEITSDTTAKGTWGLQVMIHALPADVGMWMVGYYHDEYVKENGKWKHKNLLAAWDFIVPYAQGW
jgi:hypothetical protein